MNPDVAVLEQLVKETERDLILTAEDLQKLGVDEMGFLIDELGLCTLCTWTCIHTEGS